MNEVLVDVLSGGMLQMIVRIQLGTEKQIFDYIKMTNAMQQDFYLPYVCHVC